MQSEVTHWKQLMLFLGVTPDIPPHLSVSPRHAHAQPRAARVLCVLCTLARCCYFGHWAPRARRVLRLWLWLGFAPQSVGARRLPRAAGRTRVALACVGHAVWWDE